VTYAVMPTGQVVSRVGSDIYWPILDYEGMNPSNRYTIRYKWERFSVHSVSPAEWNTLVWTRKIPLEIKNFHRQLWGMKPVKPRAPQATKRRTRRRRTRRFTRMPRALGAIL